MLKARFITTLYWRTLKLRDWVRKRTNGLELMILQRTKNRYLTKKVQSLFLGMNPGETPLAVTKDMNGQVDAITASTITSRAFLNAVNAAYQAYKGGEVDTNSGASQKNEPAVAPEGEAAANDTNN